MTDEGIGRWDGRCRWALVIALPLLTLLAAHLFFAPRFQTNDDTAMNMVAAGRGICPSPCAHLIFMSPILGKPLSLLYTYWPSICWYYLFLQGAQALANGGIAYAVLSRGLCASRVALLAGFFLTVALPFHLLPQFTQVAAMLAAAAVLLWCSRGAERPWTAASLTWFLALLGLAAMIREHSAYLIAALAAPLLALEVVGRYRSRSKDASELLRGQRLRACALALLTLGLGVAVTASCVAASHGINARSAEWRFFSVYNRTRGMLVDYGRAPWSAENKWIYDQVGWSRNDYDLLTSWFFADFNVYSLEAFQTVLAACPPRSHEFPRVGDKLGEVQGYPFFRFLAVAMLLPFCFPPRSALAWAGWLSVLLLASVLWLILAVVVRHCPPYVVYSLAAFTASVGIAGAGPLRRPQRFSFVLPGIQLAALVVLLSATRPALAWCRDWSREAVARDRALSNHLQALNPRPDQLFVAWPSCFPYEALAPYRSSACERRFKMYGLGSSVAAPIAEERLREFGISDLITALFTRQDVFVIGCPEHVQMLRTFIREHRHVETTFRKLSFPGLTTPPQFTVYQFSRARP